MDPGSGKNIHFNRVYIIVFGLIVLWILIEARLFSIQITNHDFYVNQSHIQSAKKIVLPARRGTIFDRNGEQVATNLIHYDLGVDLRRVKNKTGLARKLSAIFKKPADYYLRKMNRGSDYVNLERNVESSFADQLFITDEPGLVKIKGFRRFYPYKNYASQLIGFTNVDDKGIAGLELQYEETLCGTQGWTFLLADAKRRFGYDVDLPHVLPEPGHDMVLTLDKNFQTIVEDELSNGVNKFKANHGIAVLMDPHSGEILAMATTPGFDLNKSGQSSQEERRNRAISDIFEPGSTFKVFPAAALLQENIKKPDDIVFCYNGSYKFHGHVINDSKKHAWLPFHKVIEYSSNIGMVKLTEDLPSRTFYRYLKNFGFDSKTGINLIGEETGLLAKPETFSGLSKGVISFGQEVGVTAVQILSAFSAVINGGQLMRPYVVKSIIGADGTVVEETEPQLIRRVISEEVSATLRTFLLNAVVHGTGQKVEVQDVLMGGKTGTAQKYNMETRRYKRNAYFSSFIGFAPYESPKYVLGIFLDEPKPRYYGGDVAAPIFSSIMKRLMKLAPGENTLRVPENMIADKRKNIPDFQGFELAAVEEFCQMNDLAFEVAGKGTHVRSQSNETDEIKLVLGDPEPVESKMPNLRGKTVREALKLINFKNIRVQISGRGVIIKQSLPPGSTITGRNNLLLTCSES
ncbi:MAG: PASTA domain-containing protein [Calditrichales bacterium]|nr:MAG: PASTA domain-containing protein [Calditrichales bacterium]